MLKPTEEYMNNLKGKKVEIFLESGFANIGKFIGYDKNSIFLLKKAGKIVDINYKDIKAVGEVLASAPGISINPDIIKDTVYPFTRQEILEKLYKLHVSWIEYDLEVFDYCPLIEKILYDGWPGFKNYSNEELKKLFENFYNPDGSIKE